MTTFHKSLTKGRWHTLTIFEQLGNVGSEYERAVRWKENNDDRFQGAFERLLELLDLTIADPRWRNHRLKELVRMREEVCKEFFESSDSVGGLSKYFLQFAYAARLKG